MKEEWRIIEEYPNYQVSNTGKVKSLNKNILLKQQQTDKGYFWVLLYKNNKQKRMLVHRLVAMAFIPNPNNYTEVNHKDENKQSNIVDNLEWCTHQYNCTYGTRIEKMAANHKKPIAAYKDGVEVMRFSSLIEAKSNGFNNISICLCCKGKWKKYKGFIWKYLE